MKPFDESVLLVLSSPIMNFPMLVRGHAPIPVDTFLQGVFDQCLKVLKAVLSTRNFGGAVIYSAPQWVRFLWFKMNEAAALNAFFVLPSKSRGYLCFKRMSMSAFS